MKNKILCVYFIFFIGISQCDEGVRSRSSSGTMDTFEFGGDPIKRQSGEVTFTKSGTIGALEKNVRIPIVIPECTDLTYVRVDVDNPIGPPYVTMDYDLNTVVIKYRPLQYSLSSYVITAKSKLSPLCTFGV
ncbi:uncharacterized protein LOC123870949 [Maniola jurtina]|uniref:uncharacterized protein LOC123870949 n=1 Tax=Maniola jurtina TaxID=191418 RepID=UPI001E68E2EA|nr:uncharacterized protein LOC123870949 [Maniola jurtina]